MRTACIHCDGEQPLDKGCFYNVPASLCFLAEGRTDNCSRFGHRDSESVGSRSADNCLPEEYPCTRISRVKKHESNVQRNQHKQNVNEVQLDGCDL